MTVPRRVRFPERPEQDLTASDPTNNERQRRWRDRLAGKIPPAPKLECVACGKVHTGARGDHCSRCWELLTTEGKAFRAARVRKWKAKHRAEKKAAAEP